MVMGILTEMVDKVKKKLNSDHGANPPKDGFIERARAAMKTYAALIIFIAFALCFILYVSVGSSILARKHPVLNDINIPEIKVELDARNNTMSIGGTAPVLVSFLKTNSVKAYPEFGYFVLSKKVSSSHTIRSVSSTRYQISRNDHKLEVKFKSYQLHFQENQTMAFQKMLNDGSTWVSVDGYFRMYLKLARFLPFPYAHHNLHFGCDIMLSGTSFPLEKIAFTRCMALKS